MAKLQSGTSRNHILTGHTPKCPVCRAYMNVRQTKDINLCITCYMTKRNEKLLREKLK